MEQIFIDSVLSDKEKNAIKDGLYSIKEMNPNDKMDEFAFDWYVHKRNNVRVQFEPVDENSRIYGIKFEVTVLKECVYYDPSLGSTTEKQLRDGGRDRDEQEFYQVLEQEIRDCIETVFGSCTKDEFELTIMGVTDTASGLYTI